MDVTAWIMVAIAAVGCLITSITLIVKVTRLISSIELNIGVKISDTKSTIKTEFYRENEKLRSEVATALIPLRSLVEGYERKHSELELYIRDNYIEVDTFSNAIGEIKTMMKDLSVKLDRMNDDSLNWRRGQSSK